MIDAGRYSTIADLAAQEGIAPSYLTRILRLTLLVPDIVEAILDRRQGPAVTLARLMDGFPEVWGRQHLDTLSA